MPESVQSCFELAMHLSVKRTSRELLLKIVCGKEYREMKIKFYEGGRGGGGSKK